MQLEFKMYISLSHPLPETKKASSQLVHKVFTVLHSLITASTQDSSVPLRDFNFCMSLCFP